MIPPLKAIIQSYSSTAHSRGSRGSVSHPVSSELTIAAKVDASLCGQERRENCLAVRNKCEQVLVLDDEASQVRETLLSDIVMFFSLFL